MRTDSEPAGALQRVRSRVISTIAKTDISAMKTKTQTPEHQHVRPTSSAGDSSAETTPIAFYIMMGLMAIAFVLFVGVLISSY